MHTLPSLVLLPICLCNLQEKLKEAEDDASSQFERVSELENEATLLEARTGTAEAAQEQLQRQLDAAMQEAAGKPVCVAATVLCWM